MNLRNIVLVLFISIFFPWVGLPVLVVMAIVWATKKTEPLGLQGRRDADAWAKRPSKYGATL